MKKERLIYFIKDSFVSYEVTDISRGGFLMCSRCGKKTKATKKNAKHKKDCEVKAILDILEEGK